MFAFVTFLLALFAGFLALNSVRRVRQLEAELKKVKKLASAKPVQLPAPDAEPELAPAASTKLEPEPRALDLLDTGLRAWADLNTSHVVIQNDGPAARGVRVLPSEAGAFPDFAEGELDRKLPRDLQTGDRVQLLTAFRPGETGSEMSVRVRWLDDEGAQARDLSLGELPT